MPRCHWYDSGRLGATDIAPLVSGKHANYFNSIPSIHGHGQGLVETQISVSAKQILCELKSWMKFTQRNIIKCWQIKLTYDFITGSLSAAKRWEFGIERVGERRQDSGAYYRTFIHLPYEYTFLKLKVGRHWWRECVLVRTWTCQRFLGSCVDESLCRPISGSFVARTRPNLVFTRSEGWADWHQNRWVNGDICSLTGAFGRFHTHATSMDRSFNTFAIGMFDHINHYSEDVTFSFNI